LRKAQISQVFVYILAIIVFSLVLLFGYKSIKGLISQSEKVDYIHFKTKLESTIKRVDYGDIIIEEFTIPKGYNDVCFIDLKRSGNTNNVIIDDSWTNGVDANVFLVASQNDVDSFYTDKDKLSVPAPNYVCIPVTQGRIKVNFEGIGKEVQVSIPTP